jgi:cytochrome c556
MTRRHVRASIVIGNLAVFALGGCASSSSTTTASSTPIAPKMSAAQIVAERQRLMKLNGASWQDAQAKFKAGNIEGIAVNAETMAMNAREIPKLFPEGSMTTDSKAKPEIWQKWPDFEADAKKFQALSEQLRDAAKSKNTAATDEIMKNFGREACGTCHTPFRVPPPTRG